MKGMVIKNGYSDIPQYDRQIERIMEEFNARGIEVDLILNKDYGCFIEEQSLRSREGYDFCLFLDKDDYASKIIESAGIRVFNKPAAIEVCDDKMLTYLELSDMGIPIPDTTPGPLYYNPDIPLDDSTLTVLEARYGYPMVVKECYGSQGKGVYLVNYRQELYDTLMSVRDKKHLIQRYISSSEGEDLRVIVIGGRAIGGMIRHSDKDFRSNAALGGTTYAVDIPQESKDIAETVSQILGLDYCGVDLLKDGNGDYRIVCEVNSNAFFSAFEESTGINVAGILVQYIAECMGIPDQTSDADLS